MKKYEKPTAELVALNTTDIIMVSGTLTGGEGAELAGLQVFAWNE